MRAFVPTQDHRAEHLRQPGAEVAAGDLREIADVEADAGNNRAAGKATASSFLNSDARLRVPAGGVVSARGMTAVDERKRAVIVTGASRGIGGAIAEKLSDESYGVVVQFITGSDIVVSGGR